MCPVVHFTGQQQSVAPKSCFHRSFEGILFIKIFQSPQFSQHSVHFHRLKAGFVYLLTPEQQQLSEAFGFFANILWNSHEGVRQEGKWTGPWFLFGSGQRFVVKINQIGFVRTFARKPNGTVLLQQEVSNICAHHSLNDREKTASDKHISKDLSSV